jgi:hypothetical protein
MNQRSRVAPPVTSFSPSNVEVDLKELAEELRLAYASGPKAPQAILHSYFAPSVELRHHPEAADGDGLRDGPELAAFQRQEAETLAAAILDYRHDNVVVTTVENEISVDTTIRGSLASGDKMEVPLCLRYRFTSGRITGMDAYLGSVPTDQRAAMSQTLREGGIATSD